MEDHVQEYNEDFTEDCDVKVNPPVPLHLFKKGDNTELLIKSNRKLFHKIVAKLLLISNRARPDIVVPISFVTSRVNKATVEDWKKLKQVVCYLKGKIKMKLTIFMDNLSVMKT